MSSISKESEIRLTHCLCWPYQACTPGEPKLWLTDGSKCDSAAKAYISELKRAAGSDDDDEEGNNAFLSDRLKQDALEASGRVQRQIADRIVLDDVPSTSECSMYGEGRLMRGHRLSATAVALSHDDKYAFTVTKCGGIFQYDIETSKRCDAVHDQWSVKLL